MLRLILIALLVLSANPLLAQQPAATSPKSKTIEASPGARPSDSASMAAAIRDSYYHPDGISGLDCAVSVDWPAFFSALKLNPAADRLKAIQSLNGFLRLFCFQGSGCGQGQLDLPTAKQQAPPGPFFLFAHHRARTTLSDVTASANKNSARLAGLGSADQGCGPARPHGRLD